MNCLQNWSELFGNIPEFSDSFFGLMTTINDFPTLEEYNVKLAGSAANNPTPNTPTPQPVTLAKPAGRPGAAGSGKAGASLPRDALESLENMRLTIRDCIVNNDAYEPDSALN